MPSSPDALSALRRSILRRGRLWVAAVGAGWWVRSADSGFLSPQAGVFGSTSERAVADSAQVDRGRTTRLDLGFGNGTEARGDGDPSRVQPIPSGGGRARFGPLARPSRAALVSRGPSGLGDAGQAQPAVPECGYPLGCAQESAGGESGERSVGASLVRSLQSIALRGGRANGRRHRVRWPRPRSTDVLVIRRRPFGARGWKAGAEGERCPSRISGSPVALRGRRSLG